MISIVSDKDLALGIRPYHDPQEQRDIKRAHKLNPPSVEGMAKLARLTEQYKCRWLTIS